MVSAWFLPLLVSVASTFWPTLRVLIGCFLRRA
jgi:hypothetical protein